MIQRILNDYRDRRDELLKFLSDNFDMFNDQAVNALKKMQDHVYAEDKTIRDLVYKLNERIHFKNEVRKGASHIEANIDRAKAFYLSKKIYEDYKEESQADKWLINALILIVRDCYSFDGVMFKKGKKSLLGSDILKGDWKEVDNVTLEYKELER